VCVCVERGILESFPWRTWNDQMDAEYK
jgi:hypothetical protein